MGVDDIKDSNAQYKYYYFLSLYIEVSEHESDFLWMKFAKKYHRKLWKVTQTAL